MTARVRRLHEVRLRLRGGRLDEDEIRRATERVGPGDDVVVVIRGGLVGPEPGAASLLGRCLVSAGKVSIFVTGGYGELFRQTVEQAIALEAGS